jgi:hypothetical protein
MSRRGALRVGDRVPPDAVEFMSLVQALPPERYRSLLDCIAHLPPGLSGAEKVRRIGIALGHSEAAVEQRSEV